MNSENHPADIEIGIPEYYILHQEKTTSLEKVRKVLKEYFQPIEFVTYPSADSIRDGSHNC